MKRETGLSRWKFWEGWHFKEKTALFTCTEHLLALDAKFIALYLALTQHETLLQETEYPATLFRGVCQHFKDLLQRRGAPVCTQPTLLVPGLEPRPAAAEVDGAVAPLLDGVDVEAV